MCRTVCMSLCACIDLGLCECLLTCLCVCVCVCVCVYCLGTNCAQSTGSVFGWSCLKAGLQMNRLLSSRSGPSEPFGESAALGASQWQGRPVGCQRECRVFFIITSCCVGLPRGTALLCVYVHLGLHQRMLETVSKHLWWLMTIWQLRNVISVSVCVCVCT